MDDLTRDSTERLLRAGIAQLTPVEQQLLEAIYFEETRGSKRHFREQYGMNRAMLENTHISALGKLKAWLRECRVSRIADLL